MIKEGRKPSNDPAQEKLRQGKTVWNKEVSSFINDLIHVKKLMNGWPSKYYKERSKIIAPVPVDAASILNGLASQFQELSQQGASLAQQQAEYAKNRRQKRVDQGTQTLNKLDEKYGPTESIIPPPLAPTAPAGGDLAAKLSMWEKKYELVAEGSNPFSRFLAKVKTPRIGFSDAAQRRRLRMDMLKAAVKSYRALGKMQVHITKSSKQSVVDAYKSEQEAWNEWSVVSRNFNLLVNSMPDQTVRPDDMKDEAPPGTEQDLPAEKPKEIAKPPVKPTIPISEPPPPIKDSEMPPPDTEKKKDAIPTTTAQLEVVAQAFIQKWLGKTRHQLIPGSSSGLRLQVYELGSKTRKCINSVMDLLEKGFDVQQLGPRISEVSSNINTLRSLMRSLHNTEKPAPKGKNNPSAFDGIF